MTQDKIEKYRQCKYNTSKVTNFVGYCDLPKYHHEKGRQLVECCADNNCEDLIIEDEDED